MPVLKQGFLFEHVEKIVCGVVALGILASVGWAYLAAGRVDRTIPIDEIEKWLIDIQGKINAPPPPFSDQAWLEDFQALQQIEPAQPLRPYVFNWPLPVHYPATKVGARTAFELQFTAPLAKGSITVSPELLELVEHPMGDDYTRARFRSGLIPGAVLVVGRHGDVRHEYPVTVDIEVKGNANPPAKLAAVSGQSGITLTLEANPKNAAEGVKVTSYNVFRRDWDDPLGDYVSVGTVAPDASGRIPPVRDESVVPGQKYSYKVRTVGANTYPVEGEFAEPVQMDAAPAVTFKMTGKTGDKVRFELARTLPQAGSLSARFQKEIMMVAVGDEIGGVKVDTRTGQMNNFLTGALLVDCQTMVARPDKRGSYSDRVVYADPQGNLQARWKNE